MEYPEQVSAEPPTGNQVYLGAALCHRIEVSEALGNTFDVLKLGYSIGSPQAGSGPGTANVLVLIV